MNMRDRLVDLIDQKQDYGQELGVNRKIVDNDVLADYLIQNGVIVPPYRYLQKCFVIPTVENGLTCIAEMKCIGFSLSRDSYNANLITDKNKLYQPCFGDFGKTVFLTREEAEKALERSKQ